MVSKRGASVQPVAPRSRLYLSSLSHLKHARIRRILTLAGFDIRIGVPNPGDHVALWGEGHTADRGRWLAKRRGAQLLFLEDGFMRSVRPGRTGEPPLGLLIDKRGPYFDARLETDLERLLQTAPMEDQSELARADALVDRVSRAGIGKYNCMLGEVPEPGFVLVVDQTLGDRAVAGAQASRATFAQMLKAARAEYPDRRIVIQQHPETALGLRKGYLETPEHGITLLSEPAPSYALIHAAH
ncbi:MAG: capsular polysaccharide biosynthesis protein, partial [Pseudomonadota bacterium]